MNILFGAFVTINAFIIGMDGCVKLYVRVVLEPNSRNPTINYAHINFDDYALALTSGKDLVESVRVAGRRISPDLSNLLQNGENIYYG